MSQRKSEEINIGDKELRSFPLVELRVTDGDKPKIEGYASVFNQKSEMLWGFREIVKPGAFKKTIQESDIRALFNHDPNYVLGRKKNGSLALSEDEKGLRISIDPPETQWARDLLVSIRRGDIDQMSFGFQTVKDEWRTDGEEKIRDLIEARLLDISPVTFPAYPQTTVSVRNMVASFEGEPPAADHLAEHSQEPSTEPVTDEHSIELKKRQLSLIEKEMEVE
jgi:HK97 family phage prohead protease